MFRGLLLLYLIIFISAKPPDQKPKDDYILVKPKQGDGVLSLLRRYGLEKYSCDINKFYSLNNFEKGSNLRSDISYKLPMLVFKYDKKSIRSSLKLKDLDQALLIQQLNEKLFKDKLKPKSFKEDLNLWVPYHEFYCAEENKVKASSHELLTDKPSRIDNYPIFGNKYGKVPKIDDKLKGRVFYVESGHGGPDPGAMAEVNNNIISEDEYAYDIALRLARLLTSHGAIVYVITRDLNDGIRDEKYLEVDNDEVCYGGLTMPLNQKKRLQQRANAINILYLKHKKQGVKDQRAILIHVDSRAKTKRRDVFFYYQDKVKKSKLLAQNVQEVFASKYEKHQKYRDYEGSVSTRNLLMLREVYPPTVFVEVGNIKNPFDQKRILQYQNRQSLAEWLYDGIIE